MQEQLPFDHHEFCAEPDEGECAFVNSSQAAAQETPLEMATEISKRFHNANVRHVFLLHGTFAGDDGLGWMRRIGWVSPSLAEVFRQIGKSVVDQVAGQVGNFTEQYAENLGQIVNASPSESTPVTVGRFHWSGENHHLGRAHAAVILLDQFFQSEWTPDERLLLMAHSHGGNVIAMVTSMLGAGPVGKRIFCRAMRPHFHGEQRAMWQRVEAALEDPDRTRRLPKIDVVTMGTPLRYGWNRRVVSKLLHVVHHRTVDQERPTAAVIPRQACEVLQADAGDYVQHVGINGTDFPHPLLALPSRRSERWLRRLFEPRISPLKFKRNYWFGNRIAKEGKTLLVDYPDDPKHLNRKLAGHGVYTCQPWLSFHLQRIAEEFYGGDAS